MPLGKEGREKTRTSFYDKSYHNPSFKLMVYILPMLIERTGAALVVDLRRDLVGFNCFKHFWSLIAGSVSIFIPYTNLFSPEVCNCRPLVPRKLVMKSPTISPG